MMRTRKTIFLVVLNLVVCLVLVELASALYLRVLAPDPRPLAVRNVPWHVYDAYRNHALGPGWSSRGRVHDQQGFRRTSDVQQEKPAGVYRIFLMGGSAAYGLSAPPPFPSVEITNEQTIDAHLERQLQTLFPEKKIEVINAAVTGYWTHQHLIYLHETLLDYHPDLIIFLDGINDYYHTRDDHRQFGSYQYSMTLRVAGLNDPGPLDFVRPLLGWAKKYSHAAYVADQAADRLLHWSDVPEDPCNTESIPPADLNAAYLSHYEEISRRTWVRTLRSILMLLNDEGIGAITSLQPELIFSQTHGTSEGDRRLYALETSLRPKYYKEKKEFLKPAARHLAETTATDLGATFVDLTDVFDGDAQYFIDYCHLSEAGAARLAERLLPYVVERIHRGAPARPHTYGRT
jgi:lysophospholipase L1-like esterase